jgi:SPP1 gp7 family putative phage head morphogenesis protein
MTALLDQFGRPVEARKRPDSGRVAALTLRDRWASYPSRGLTPQRLAAIFTEADDGDVARQAELFAEMEEKDSHLASVLQTRKMGPLGLPRRVVPCSDERADVEAAELVEEVLGGLDLDDLVLDLMDAVGKGFAVSEIEWQTGARVTPAAIHWVPQTKCVWDGHELRLLTEDAPSRGEPLQANKFLVHVYRARSGWPSRQGMMRPAAWMYLFKNYAIKDWVQFAEVFGMPLRLGKYDPAASKEDKDALYAAVMAIAADAAGIISRNTEIEFIEAGNQGGSSAEVYERLASYCDRGMSKVILGQTLTTDTSGSTGTYAAGAVHDRVRQDLLEADVSAVCRVLQRDLARPIVGFNLGWDRALRLPTIEMDTRSPEQIRAEAEEKREAAKTIRILTKDIGLPVGRAHLYERFEIPEPEKGEAVVGGAPVGETKPLKADLAGGGELLVLAGGPTEDPEQLDALIAAAVNEAAPAVDQWIDQVRAEISVAASLEDLRVKLLERYPDLSLTDLQATMALAVHTADLYGRLQVPMAAGGPGWRPLPFDEARAYFRGKVVLPDGQWKALAGAAQDRAFAVSGLARLDLVQGVYAGLERAISTGSNLATFRKDIDQVIQSQGWTGPAGRWRVETIFRTNVLSSYSAGHYAQMKASKLPYWQYDAVGDRNTRPEHAAMDGRVFRADDPIWDTWYPPNGFNCRCTVRAMSESEVQARGLELDEGRHFEGHEPDAGFRRNVGQDWQAGLAEGRNRKAQGGALKPVEDLPDHKHHGLPDLQDMNPESLPSLPAAYGSKLGDDVGASVRKVFGGGIKDVLGDPVIPSERLVEHLAARGGHEKALPILPEILGEPLEVWGVPHTDGRRVVMRKRYITMWKPEGREKGALAVVETDGIVCEALTVFPSSDKYLNRQRRGVLLHRREE